MSFKSNSFASIIAAPMPTHNYLIDIPDLPGWIPQLVESAGFPSETMTDVMLTLVGGEEVHYPSTPTWTHTWAIRIPDSDRAAVYSQFEKLLPGWDQDTGVMELKKWRKVKVYLRDLEDQAIVGKELHGAWLQKFGDVSLGSANRTTPLKWDFTFVFSWIKDIKPDKLANQPGGFSTVDRFDGRDNVDAKLNTNQTEGGPMNVVSEGAIS